MLFCMSEMDICMSDMMSSEIVPGTARCRLEKRVVRHVFLSRRTYFLSRRTYFFPCLYMSTFFFDTEYMWNGGSSIHGKNECVTKEFVQLQYLQ